MSLIAKSRCRESHTRPGPKSNTTIPLHVSKCQCGVASSAQPLDGRSPGYRKVDLANKPLISIVDDDEPLRQATKGLIRALGYRAEIFGSAEDFLRFDRLRSTACLIADIQMPRMSGLELHRHLVRSGFSIPTILITAYPDDHVRARALEAGVSCYLTKPFSKADLLACIHSALDRGREDSSS